MNKLNIKSKSILKRASGKDGLRICVMRRIKPEYKFDIWIPEIAPYEKLLNAYVVNKTITWNIFKKKYTLQILSKRKDLITALKKIASVSKTTLLCFEESDKYCHRSLIINEIKKLKA